MSDLPLRYPLSYFARFGYPCNAFASKRTGKPNPIRRWSVEISCPVNSSSMNVSSSNVSGTSATTGAAGCLTLVGLLPVALDCTAATTAVGSDTAVASITASSSACASSMEPAWLLCSSVSASVGWSSSCSASEAFGCCLMLRLTRGTFTGGVSPTDSWSSSCPVGASFASLRAASLASSCWTTGLAPFLAAVLRLFLATSFGMASISIPTSGVAPASATIAAATDS